MESYQKELALIRTVLKNNPKGMTVTDVAREININRNSVAKYLDILLISGQVEMITFGPAKVFFPSRRVPLPTLLNFISDYILVLDTDQKIVMINNTFLSFLGIERDEVINQSIDRTNVPFFSAAEMLEHITNALDGKEHNEEICIQTDNEEYYFCIRLLPTTFEDGGQGVILIFTNITDKRRIENALQGNKQKSATVKIYNQKQSTQKK